MSRLSKIKEKLLRDPIAKDFTWDELSCLLLALGYIKKEGSGSRVKFFHKETKYPISLHKPHPGNEIKPRALKRIRDETQKCGCFKMKDTIKYKKYIGSVEIDMEEKVLHGKVLFINGLITYESINFDLDELKHEFKESVDEYLADCDELGLEPELPCKGVFNVRIPSELHRAANLLAMRKNESLNTLVKRAIEIEVSEKTINHKHDVTVCVNHSVIMEKKFEGEYEEQKQAGEYGKLRIVK